jgi:hypothetical protein
MGGDCEIGCPTSCISDTVLSVMSTPGYTTSGENTLGNDNMDWGSYGRELYSRAYTELAEGIANTNELYKMRHLQKSSNDPNIIIGYQITDQDQLNPLSTVLNDQLTSFIKQMFDYVSYKEAKPTPYFMDLFNSYTNDYDPADEFHIEKLHKIIYYLIINILPGLPNILRPNTYVVWQPYR